MAAAPDDPGVGKFLILGIALLFVGVLRLSVADWENAEIPFLAAAKAENSALKSAESLGTPSAVALPESDPSTWFATEAGAPAPWLDIQLFAAATSTPGGWAEACKAVSAVAGADRAATPALGALACSTDPAVTELQQFAVELLAAQAEVALWLQGIPGHDAGVVAARLAEVRQACENGLPSRLAGAESPYLAACTASLTTTPLAASADALQASLGEAYALVAADLAVRDPEIDAEAASSTGNAATPAPTTATS